MSYGGYNPYGDNGGGRGYGADPFDDRNALQYGAGTHEMASFSPGRSPQAAPFSAGNSPQMGYGSPGPQNQNSILDECTDIQRGIRDIENKLGVLGALQKRSLEDADMSGGSNTKRELDNLTQAVMDQYRQLTDRLRIVKSNPDSRQQRNKSQVNKADQDLRKAIQKFQELEAGSRREMQTQMERQARLVYPDATDSEIADIVKDDNQIFQQAVMGVRAEKANRVLGAVKERHQDMLKIERDLMQLLDLLNDMQELLTKQEEVIVEVGTNTAKAADLVEDANTKLEIAAVSSRGARKKKFICLGICVLIVVIIVVAVVAYIMVNRAANGGGSKKRNLFQRSVMDDLQMNTARAVEVSPRLPRRLASRARGVGAAPNHEVEVAAKKRFVVDWEGAGPTGSDD
ncbi:t-SNARE [Parachaetomium inaequale]|uniref:t-SNARE n=1 Tax=Parachaetomium inaequale TaxID=2588326 RepID=A0AAN6PEY5_9PEZI|nr:t-SNARE [Parachaetomium inaequale]